MKAIVTFAASLVVNFGALGALDWSAHQAQIAPRGEVLVIQLPDTSDLSMYADAGTYHTAKSL
jgi:hypothetical protein